jgi:O-antigen ligase
MLFHKGNKNQAYINFVLLVYPFMHILIATNLGLFEVISILFFFLFYKQRPTYQNEVIGYGYLFGLFTLILIVGLAFSPIEFDNDNLKDTRRLFPIFIYGKILIEECLHDEAFSRKVLHTLSIILAVALVFLAIQMVVGLNFKLVNTLNPNVTIRKGIRYPGYFSDPQQFSQFLGALSFICLIPWKDEKIPTWRYLAAGFAIVGILAAGGRAGLMGWALGLFFYLLFSNPKRKMTILFMGLILGTVAFYFQDNLAIFNRGTDLNETYDFRAQIWDDALEIFMEYPFFGIGIGNYAPYVFLHYPDQLLLINNEIVSFDQPESGYLLFLTELGGLGFICVMLFVLIPMIRSFFFYFRSRNLMYIQFISAICCWLIGFYSTYSLGDVRIMILVGSILSLMVVFRLREKQEMNATETELIPET